MGSSNFLQHNPTAANQEDDSTYAGDSTRTGGIGVDQIMPSPWMNKIWYQSSTFIAAFAGALANKGYNLSDANLSTLEAVLANVLTTADTKPAQIIVPFSPTPTFDGSKANGFRISLGGNVTSSSLINTPVAGTIVTFFIISGSPGNYSFAWPSNVINPGDVQTQSNGNLYTQSFISDGANLYPLEGLLQVFQNYINTLNGDVSSIDGQIAAIDNSFPATLAALGSQQIFGKTIVKWGHVTTDINGGTLPVSFDAHFPNNCFVVVPVTLSTTDRITYVVNGSVTTSGFTIGNNGSSGYAYWVAIGN